MAKCFSGLNAKDSITIFSTIFIHFVDDPRVCVRNFFYFFEKHREKFVIMSNNSYESLNNDRDESSGDDASFTVRRKDKSSLRIRLNRVFSTGALKSPKSPGACSSHSNSRGSSPSGGSPASKSRYSWQTTGFAGKDNRSPQRSPRCGTPTKGSSPVRSSATASPASPATPKSPQNAATWYDETRSWGTHIQKKPSLTYIPRREPRATRVDAASALLRYTINPPPLHRVASVVVSLTRGFIFLPLAIAHVTIQLHVPPGFPHSLSLRIPRSLFISHCIFYRVIVSFSLEASLSVIQCAPSSSHRRRTRQNALRFVTVRYVCSATSTIKFSRIASFCYYRRKETSHILSE